MFEKQSRQQKEQAGANLSIKKIRKIQKPNQAQTKEAQVGP